MRKLALTILVLLVVGVFPVVSWAVDKILPIDYTEADRNSREIWEVEAKVSSEFTLVDALMEMEELQANR